MKFLAESYVDVSRLVRWYLDGEISAEEYYESVDEYAELMIDREINESMVHRRPSSRDS